MWVNIDAKFLDKTRKDASEQAISESGEEGKGFLRWDTTNEAFDEIEVNEDKIVVMVSNELGSFSFDIPLDSEMLEQILAVTIKKMNKIKSMLESLK